MKYPWLDEFLLSHKGAEKDFKVEWQWHRYLVGGKMFGAVCEDKLGKPIVTLKCEPAFGALLRQQYSDIVAGHYMNKEHWNSVSLLGDVPDDVVKEMVTMSYGLVLSGLTKKVQNAIAEQ